MKIPNPKKNRLKVIHEVYANNGDPDILTPWEMTWLENFVMEKILDKLSDSNSMVFYGEDSHTVN